MPPRLRKPGKRGRTFDDLLVEDYFDLYSEAHRRRATALLFPAAMMHIALYYPRRYLEVKPFLTELFGRFAGYLMLDGMVAGRAFDNPAQAAEHIADHYDATKSSRTPQQMLYELKETSTSDLTWRIVCHREFVTLTLHAKLGILHEGEGIVIDSSLLGGRRIADRNVSDSQPGALTRILFSDLQQALKTCLEAKIVAATNAWEARPSLSPAGKRQRPGLFASFYGCCVPWQAFEGMLAARREAGEATDVNQPFFPPTEAEGFPPGAQNDPKMKRTQRFLADVWPFLKVDAMDDRHSDVVACYVQHGHCIYVSNLGAQPDEKRPSPLKYLLLYCDPLGSASQAAAPVTATERALAIGLQWRLARLINRLHRMGTTRLAALQSMGLLLRFGQKLRQFEVQLQQNREEYENTRSLRKLERKISMAAHEVDDLIYYRASRSAKYLAELEDLDRGLGVLSIPTWQSYDQFLRMRVFGSIRHLVGLGERYQRLMQSVGLMANSNRAREFVSLQRAAHVLGVIFLFYYVPKIVTESIPSLYLNLPEVILKMFKVASLQGFLDFIKQYSHEVGLFLALLLGLPLLGLHRFAARVGRRVMVWFLRG